MKDENQKPTILPPSNQGTLGKTFSHNEIIHQSSEMAKVAKVVDKVSLSTASVLLVGEGGCGKEYIARSIHEKGHRKGKPFVSINCWALKEALLEDEFFGSEKVGYEKKRGLLEKAHGGTLFLNEISDLNLDIQLKLLRFLKEGKIYRVGGNHPVDVDIRLICSTAKNLSEEIKDQKFSSGLFYQINTVTINVPSLRKRKEDIRILMRHFLALSSKGGKYLSCIDEIDDEATKVLESYEWPGNVKELQNFCERLQIFVEGNRVSVDDLPQYMRFPQNKKIIGEYDPSMTLHDLNKQYILKALNHFQGNKTRVAHALGITIKTLYNKLHEYDEFKKYSVHSRKSKSS